MKAFVEAAERYCAIIEAHRTTRKIDLILQCAEAIPLVNARAIALLYVNPGPTDDPNCISDEVEGEMPWTHSQLYRSLGRQLDKHDSYWLTFGVYALEDNDPMEHTLSDDLSDIYLDLKRGFLQFGKVSDQKDRDVVWYWRFNFFIHTFRHCFDAIRVLNYIVAEHFQLPYCEWPVEGTRTKRRRKLPKRRK